MAVLSIDDICKELTRINSVVNGLLKNEGQLAFDIINIKEQALRLSQSNDCKNADNLIKDRLNNVFARLQALEESNTKLQKTVEDIRVSLGSIYGVVVNHDAHLADLEKKQDERHKQYCADNLSVLKQAMEQVVKSHSALDKKIDEQPKVDSTLSHDSVQTDIKKMLEPVAWDAKNGYQRSLGNEARIAVLEKKIEHIVLLARRLEAK